MARLEGEVSVATSRTLEQFARRMEARAREVLDNTEVAVQIAALTADRVVVLATPVDTGRARANWVTSIGSPVFTEQATPGAGSGKLWRRPSLLTWMTPCAR